MKRLVIAICCLAMGTGAFAANSNTAKPAEKTVKVTVVKGLHADSKETAVAPTIQRCFLVGDACGNLWRVWVSGGSYTQARMVAYNYILDMSC